MKVPTPVLGPRDVVPGVLIALLLAASVAALFVGGQLVEAAGVLVMVIGHGTAALTMFRRSRDLPAHERRPWRAMSLALVFSSSGLVVVAALGAEGPVFGPADVFFVLAYTSMVVALALFARMDGDGRPWRMTMLDVAVGAVAAAALIWDVVLDDLVVLQATTLERVGLSLYPVLDVAILIGLCLVALRRSTYRFDVRLLLIAVAMTVQVAADLLYMRSGLQADTFQQAQPQMWLFFLATALYLAAATTVPRRPAKKEFPDREAPLWAIIWPYLLAFALVPRHILRLEELFSDGSLAGDTTSERVIIYALLLVGLLIVVRQWVAIRHNRIRVEHQRRDLIASVSHELRTPLTAVVGFLQVLEEEPEAFSVAERESMMTEASNQAKHMARTVTDLITLARDGGATMVIRSGEASLADIVASASEEAFGVTFTTDVADHLVRVDADRLDQAIGHMLANARQYGGSRIHLRAFVEDGAVTVDVHDDGPGVPTRHLSSVWNQFDRGTRRLDSSSPGVGIGLSIVRAVAVAHGGTAGYRRSELLGGACFSIVMPANTRSGAPWIRELSSR